MFKRMWQFKKITVLICLLMIYLCFSFSLKSISKTYAWFNSSSISRGELVNATTADLIKINLDDRTYLPNGRIKPNVTVENIAEVDIPLQINLIVDQKVLASTSTFLKSNTMFTTTFGQIKKGTLDTNSIQVQIVGFNGYINEIIPVPLDPSKIKQNNPSEKKSIPENTTQESTTDMKEGTLNNPEPTINTETKNSDSMNLLNEVIQDLINHVKTGE